MSAEILNKFTELVSTLPTLDEFPEESRAQWQDKESSTKITLDLIKIFEQYFTATTEEVERFKRKGDPDAIKIDDSDEENLENSLDPLEPLEDDGKKPEELPSMVDQASCSGQAPAVPPRDSTKSKSKTKQTPKRGTKNSAAAAKKEKEDLFANPIQSLSDDQKKTLGKFIVESLPNEFIYSIMKIYSDAIMEVRKERQARLDRQKERDEKRKARVREKKEQQRMAVENLGLSQDEVEKDVEKEKKEKAAKVAKEKENMEKLTSELANKLDKPTDIDEVLQPEIQRAETSTLSDLEMENMGLPEEEGTGEATGTADTTADIDTSNMEDTTMADTTANDTMNLTDNDLNDIKTGLTEDENAGLTTEAENTDAENAKLGQTSGSEYEGLTSDGEGVLRKKTPRMLYQSSSKRKLTTTTKAKPKPKPKARAKKQTYASASENTEDDDDEFGMSSDVSAGPTGRKRRRATKKVKYADKGSDEDFDDDFDDIDKDIDVTRDILEMTDQSQGETSDDYWFGGFVGSQDFGF